jgi:hypothetical protein
MTQEERADMIERYAQGPARLRAVFEKVPAEARQWRPGPGQWSAHEVVCHCADAEANAAMRIRYLLAEAEPLIVGYDQRRWVERLDYHAQPAEPALAVVEVMRASTTALLRRLPPEAWAREGRHTESGRYAADDWLRIYAVHVEGHAGQIERALAAWRTRPGA